MRPHELPVDLDNLRTLLHTVEVAPAAGDYDLAARHAHRVGDQLDAAPTAGTPTHLAPDAVLG